jgi:hypothetical protein
VTLAAGLGGADLGGGWGFELRGAWQATGGLGLGLALGTAAGGDPDDAAIEDEDEDEGLAPFTRLVSLRAFGRMGDPGLEWAAATFGAGVSATTRGLWALTADAGGVTSTTIADRVEPSLGLAAAVSLPIVQGEPVGFRDPILATTTLYLGGSLGLGVHIGDGDNVLSAEAGAWRGLAAGGARAMIYALSVADAQGFTP